ncbi:MAG: hypothetical protein KKC84_05430 [Candidatus Omnitrophica bacterium]|nr:hypothetical protein [Candidatus Omnitrophota bacterium]
MALSNEEKKELKEAASCARLRRNSRAILSHRYNPFLVDGKIDIDRIISFLDDCNAFLGHPVRAFRRIKTGANKL